MITTTGTSIPRILIAGIGNIFFGDDAFGGEVARRLAQRRLPEGVRVVDFGIRGLELTYTLLDPYEAVILVDAVPRGGRVGTVYVLEPEVSAAAANGVVVEPHSMDPVKVLRMARELGSTIERVLLVGCEPTPAADDEMQMEMSEPVQAAVEEAITLIESLVTQLLANKCASLDFAQGRSSAEKSLGT
ncbi:MAG TPA: hydrogenase maturation protease [Gemmataceae bacterium]|nr:hydrogenase maturation protease [Gemmataceae bacterium]